MMKFSKYHALGNDYLVLDPADAPELPSERDIRLICHRHFGIGSDGILYGPSPADGADFGLRIYNPDGSEAEKSGNGLRIFSRYLWDGGKVCTDPFTVLTPGGLVTCQVHGAAAELIEVEMGNVSFRSDVIPVDLPGGGDAREVLDVPVELEGADYPCYAATIGNPHAVFPRDVVTAEEAHRLGPLAEVHPMFPYRTNVQFLQVIDRANIKIEIWERGAGYTLASGSSSSAAAAVAHKMGRVDDDLTVHMPGGQIRIRIGPNYAINMSGPATRVAAVDFDPAALGFVMPGE